MGFDIGIIISFLVTLISSAIEEYSDHWAITLIKIVAPIIGLIFTILRVKKFRTYRFEFDANDWKKNGAIFEILIPKSSHKKGLNPVVEVFEGKNGGHEKIIVDFFIKDNGDVLIKPVFPFKGKVSIA